MGDSAIEKEKRRQHIARRKRRHRKLMMERAAVLVGGLLLVVILVKGIGRLFRGNAGQHQDAVTALKEENKGKDKSQAGLKEEAPGSTADALAAKTEARTVEDIGKGNLVLVNDACPLRNYENIELVDIVSSNEGLYGVKSKETKLQPEALDALNKMIKDFTKEKGNNDVGVVSGYRNFVDQERLHFESSVQKISEDTDIFVAKPDRSEHHTGLAVDLGIYHEDGTSDQYDGTDIYSWINENCYKYGFIVRYQEEKKEKTGIGNEPWHFRYVGVVHATLMKELNLCLEEYIEYLKNYRYYTNPLQQKEGDVKNYSIYYVPATGDVTEIPVPESKKYEISGNNKDGFIVTVTLS